MKKSILNLGTAIKRAEQKEITGGYSGYGGSGGSGSSSNCWYCVSSSSGVQYASCSTAQYTMWLYGSPSGSWGSGSGPSSCNV
jgi:hypothetical protein